MSDPIRVTESRGLFNVWHWNKFIAFRRTRAEADTVADDLRKKVATQRSLRQMARDDRARRLEGPRVIAPEDRNTWREDGRDPDEPEISTVTCYPKSGAAAYREQVIIPPGHPFHWSSRYRHDIQCCTEPGGIIPASLPALPYAELESLNTARPAATPVALPSLPEPGARPALLQPAFL